MTLHRTMMQPDLAREVCSFFETRNHAAMALQDVDDTFAEPLDAVYEVRPMPEKGCR